MKRTLRTFFALLLFASVGLPRAAHAQGALTITPPHAGDCSIAFVPPPGTSVTDVTISLNDDTARLAVVVREGSPFQAMLGDSLKVNATIRIKAGTASATERVQGPRPGVVPDLVVCSGQRPAKSISDERGVFEASGFVGQVFDNFSPKVNGGYKADATASTINSRVTAGIEAQYRLIGRQDSTRQLWLTSHTLHGMRTADGDCQEIAKCVQENGTAATFKYILAHASTIEAHVDARLELFTIQAGTEVPAKFYVYARAGFLDLEGASRVYDSDAVGAGIIAPKGVFRHSYAQVGWGVSKQYDLDKSFDRLKINGVLVFDLMPNLTPGGFFKDLGAGSRFFIAISIDRNVKNGPDSVQTYVGADFDLRRIFGAF